MPTQKVSPQVLKGMRDFLPTRMILRNYVSDQVRRVFEQFGFEPLQTPAIEYAETLEGKFGEEADKLIYKFEDRGERSVGLRYDLTVPLARIVSMYPELVKPFKRYQISPVWRAERPQKGRYREFYQCDVDIVGAAGMTADAEVLNVAYQALRQLGFQKFRMLINNRKLLQAIATKLAIEPSLGPAIWRAVDKWDKIGPTGVRADLTTSGLSAGLIERLFEILNVGAIATQPEAILAALRSQIGDLPEGAAGIAELEEILHYLELAGISAEHFRIDLHMVRGLDYYTGPIFEIVVDEPRIGSISGGGRYDHLIGLLGPNEYPAVGISLGLERLIDVIDELGMAPPQVRPTVTNVLVTVFDGERRAESLAIAASLRAVGLNTEVYLGGDRLANQLRYASRKNIPLALIIGPDEVARGEVVLRNLGSGEQRSVARGLVLSAIEQELQMLTVPVLSS